MACDIRVVVAIDRLDGAFRSFSPDLIVVNIDLTHGPKLVSLCRSRLSESRRIVAITDVPCLVRAGQAVHYGATAVVARPTSLAQIIAAADCRVQEDPFPMSLDRAIWEYLNQVLVECGSISAAARRLRIDRTSFKRMLRKHPPLR